MIAALLLATLPTPQWSSADVLAEMAPIIEPCVQPTQTQRVFTLCYDLHSSIHAHWAAYRLARAQPSLGSLAMDSEQALEFAKVQADQPFITYPYAQAWFLLLCVEFETWGIENGRPDPQRLRPVGADIAADLLTGYQLVPPDPRTHEYGNSSWHLLQLHRWYKKVGDVAGQAAVDDMIQQHFIVPIGFPTLRRDIINPFEFFSVHGNWVHLVLETQDQATIDSFLAMQSAHPDHHLLVPGVVSVHSLGLTWSRIWALIGLAKHAADPADRSRFRRSAALHVEVAMQRHAIHSGSFFAYDHWIPQFAVYAMTPGLLP